VGDPKDVVLLEVELHSARAWAGFSYSPWMLNIPHDDVLFGTGRSEIPPDEESKLEAVLVQLNEVAEQYGSVVPVKLYIGGCTDTVGAGGANDQLSQRRARSIAAWFRSRGYEKPIFYYGFGERWLSVQTPDEVDNPANRRAVYIVAANPPPQSGDVPPARWLAL
jgi:outer membrane protein OmpA-like peptidoglycan-associated protein